MPSESQRKSLAEQISRFHENLTGDGGEPARAYLANRGINQQAARRFRLGYDGEWLTIPYDTPAGPLLIKRRCIAGHDCKEEGHGKYKADTGSVPHLYNAQTLLRAERVVVAEGELDAVAIESAGVPAVAYPGVATWEKNQFWAYCFDSCSEVIVVADGDEPGRKAARQVGESLRRRLPDTDVRVVELPDSDDSSSLIVKEGPVAFLDSIGFL